jgi:hypothetical protein
MTFLELAAVCAIGYLASEIYDSSRVAAACATCFFAYKFYALLVVAASCRRALFVVYRRIGASVIPASRGAGFLRHVARLGAGYSSGVIGDGPPEALRRWLTPTSAAATVSVTFCAQPRLALPKPASEPSRRPRGPEPLSRWPSPKRASADAARAACQGPLVDGAPAESRKRKFPQEWRGVADLRTAMREERAQELAALFLSDTSPLALRPANDTVILALCKASLDASEAIAANGTTDKDTRAWQRWIAYCAEMDTPAFRSDVLANASTNVWEPPWRYFRRCATRSRLS